MRRYQVVQGLKYKETYIDDMIPLLQADRIKFQFLEYLSANPGINLHELENLAYYAYKTMVDGVIASATVTPALVEGVDFEDNEVGKVNALEGVTKENTGVEGDDITNNQEVGMEDMAEAGKTEDPRNTGGA